MSKWKTALRGLAIVCSAIGLLVGGSQLANAADNVVDGYKTTLTGSGLLTIETSTNFDNTNCDAGTLSNCSGLNGASVDYSVVKLVSPSGYCNASMQTSNQPVVMDIYGDSTSNYVRPASLNWVLLSSVGNCQGGGGGTRTYRADWSNPQNDVNRIKITVKLNGSLYNGTNSAQCGINPYGLSHAC